MMKMKNSYHHFITQPKYQFARHLLKVIFVWCPIVTLIFIIAFGYKDNFLQHFIMSLIISTHTALSCMIGSHYLKKLENIILKFYNKTPIEHGHLWGIFTSYIFLIPGLYLGFSVAAFYSQFHGRT